MPELVLLSELRPARAVDRQRKEWNETSSLHEARIHDIPIRIIYAECDMSVAGGDNPCHRPLQGAVADIAKET